MAKKFFLFFCSSLFVATGILCPVAIDVYAEAVPPLPSDFADIDLSDILITFPAGAGAGIKNTTVLNDLYTNYGVSGWGVGDMTPYFDIVVSATGESAGLSNNVLNEHLGDNEWFDQNGYDIKVNYNSFKQKLDATESLTKYGANYIHQATLSPSTGNPWEWDWSEILEEYFRTGLLGFEHVFLSFDTLNDIAVTMDDVLQNVYDFWTPNIQTGAPISIQVDEDKIPAGGGFACLLETGDNPNAGYDYYYESGIVSCEIYYTLSNKLRRKLSFVNTTNSTKHVYYYSGGSLTRTQSVNANNSTSGLISKPVDSSICYTDFHFASESEYDTWYANNKNNESLGEDKRSNDLINPSGNISVEDFPSMSPSIEQGQAIRPIPQQAYQNWAQTNNLADPAQNGALMGALVAPYIEAEPAPAPSPAPDDPWADPVPDTEPANRPVSPEQPDFPEEPELTAEQIDESLLGATPDLTEIFPFCIPWDIARILKQFTANRKAPYIEWTLESDLFGFSYTFEIDLAIFDDVAVILRLLELIGFILGLAILTRYLIGAN